MSERHNLVSCPHGRRWTYAEYCPECEAVVAARRGAARAVQDDGLDVERLADLIEKESRTRPHYGRTPRESAEWIAVRLRAASPLNASGDER